MKNPKIPVSMRMDPEIVEIGKKRAKELRRSFTAYVERLIEEDIATTKPKVASLPGS